MLAAGAVVACEPGGVGSASVAFTTDETVTRELQRRGTEVRWLSCTADYGQKASSGRAASASASGRTVAEVHCEGETDDGRKITVDGTVTRLVDGACVRGELTATVDGRRLFRVEGSATATPPRPRPRTARGPTGTGRPPAHGHRDGHPDGVVPGAPRLLARGQVIRSDPNPCPGPPPLHRVRA